MKHDINLTHQASQRLQELVADLQKQIAVLDVKEWKRPQDEFKGRKKKRCAQRKLTHARILLQAAQASSDPSITESSIAEDLGVDPELVELVCKQFVERGLEAALKPILTNAERAQVATWYEEHGKGVVLEVRRWLREVTRHQTGVSTSAVAQSVWASFMDNHLDESIDSTDPLCAWGILTRAAKRHCEKWNRPPTRRPKGVSLENLAGGQGDDGSPSRFDPQDTRETDPVVVLVRDECAALFAALAEEERKGVAQAIQKVERGTELVEQLTPEERQVLALKLARKTRDEIAKLLGIDQGEVDDLWESIQRKAERLGDMEEYDEDSGDIPGNPPMS